MRSRILGTVIGLGVCGVGGCAAEPDADLPVAVARPKVAGACTPSTEPPGTLLWDLDLGGAFSSPPTFEGDTAWIAQINGYTGVFAIRDDGTVTASADIKYSVEQAMTLSDDGATLYVNTIDMSGGATGVLSDGATPAFLGRGLQALDASTLAFEYTQGGGLAGRDGSPGLNNAGTTVYSATIDKGDGKAVAFYALNASDLTNRWTYTTPGWSYSSPTVDSSGNLYFGSEVTGSTPVLSTYKIGRLTSLSGRGAVRWTKDTRCEASGGPIVYTRSRVSSLVERDRCGMVTKRNPRTGGVSWQYDLGTYSLGHPVLDANNASILVPTARAAATLSPAYESGLVSLNERTGAFEWYYGFDNTDGPAIVGDAAIYAVGNDGTVVALDSDGNELWTLATGHAMHRGFAGLNDCGVLQFGTEDGHYLAVSTESTGLEPTSDCPTYRCDDHRTGRIY